MIAPSLLKRLLGNEEFENWKSLTLQKTLESMPDVVYCPRCQTSEKRHVGIMCLTQEMKLSILQARQSSTQMKDKQRQREQEMIHELLSVREGHRRI
ncbi:putative E3 ubiquitin ligase RBR family [Helianthus anomalus]